MKSVQNMLEGLGLSPNEVKVYLAGLEMGAATAQQLAAKAAVVRPTAYVAIGGLVKHGLMSSFTKGKKQYFAAEKPNRLTHLLNEEKKKLADRESKLKSVMPILDSLIAMSGEKPEVKLYEGLEGLEAMRRILLESKANDLKVITTTQYESTVPSESVAVHDYHLMKKKLHLKQIFFTNKKHFKNSVLRRDNFVRELKFEHIDDPQEFAEVAVFGRYVAMIVYLDKPYGFLVNSPQIANTLNFTFDLFWKSSSK